MPPRRLRGAKGALRRHLGGGKGAPRRHLGVPEERQGGGWEAPRGDVGGAKGASGWALMPVFCARLNKYTL